MRSRRSATALLLLNGVGIIAAGAFATAGVRRPGYIAAGEPVTPLAQFWSASSGVRTWALAVPLLLALIRPAAPSRPGLLVAAGLVQLGDAALGMQRRDAAMTAAPAVMGAVHLVSARVL